MHFSILSLPCLWRSACRPGSYWKFKRLTDILVNEQSSYSNRNKLCICWGFSAAVSRMEYVRSTRDKLHSVCSWCSCAAFRMFLKVSGEQESSIMEINKTRSLKRCGSIMGFNIFWMTMDTVWSFHCVCGKQKNNKLSLELS